MSSKASKVLDQCLIEMYKVAVPSLDLIPYLKKEKPASEVNYDKHWLPREIQTGIEWRLCKEYKLKSYDRKRLHTSLVLGASPNTCYRQWYINMIREKFNNTDFYKRFKEQIDDALKWGSYSGEFI